MDFQRQTPCNRFENDSDGASEYSVDRDKVRSSSECRAEARHKYDSRSRLNVNNGQKLAEKKKMKKNLNEINKNGTTSRDKSSIGNGNIACSREENIVIEEERTTLIMNNPSKWISA